MPQAHQYGLKQAIYRAYRAWLPCAVTATERRYSPICMNSMMNTAAAAATAANGANAAGAAAHTAAAHRAHIQKGFCASSQYQFCVFQQYIRSKRQTPGSAQR